MNDSGNGVGLVVVHVVVCHYSSSDGVSSVVKMDTSRVSKNRSVVCSFIMMSRIIWSCSVLVSVSVPNQGDVGADVLSADPSAPSYTAFLLHCYLLHRRLGVSGRLPRLPIWVHSGAMPTVASVGAELCLSIGNTLMACVLVCCM